MRGAGRTALSMSKEATGYNTCKMRWIMFIVAYLKKKLKPQHLFSWRLFLFVFTGKLGCVQTQGRPALKKDDVWLWPKCEKLVDKKCLERGGRQGSRIYLINANKVISFAWLWIPYSDLKREKCDFLATVLGSTVTLVKWRCFSLSPYWMCFALSKIKEGRRRNHFPSCAATVFPFHSIFCSLL